MTSLEMTKDFAETKTKTLEIIQNIIDIMIDFCTCIKNVEENQILSNIFDMLPVVDIQNASDNLKLNLSIISRNKMKCAFFGKTSNGKSAVINGILNENLLPSSIGRTTSCFITVDGCDDNIGYLIDKDGKKCDTAGILNIANELNQEKYDTKTVVALFWPKAKCSLLANEIQFLDSPGVDYSEEHREAIEMHCRDADVFIYVIDACSTINESEKMFFREVKAAVANPNVFILMNKWDKCQDELQETKLARVKKQHLATVKSFFELDLKMLCDSHSRTFFVSAKEMLEEATTPSKKEREAEFNRFVDMMQREMSHNAILNKFKPHLIKGKKCMLMVTDSLDMIINTKKENITEFSDDTQLKSDLSNLQDESFRKAREDLAEGVDIESQQFVSFIMENTKDLKHLDGKVKEMVQRLMDNLNRILMHATLDIINVMRAKLSIFSKINESLNTLDNYFPSAPVQGISSAGDVISATDDPTTNQSTSITDSNNDGLEDRKVNCSQNDIISTIAIIFPLNIELGMILSEEKVAKLDRKKESPEKKESVAIKLCTKIRDLLFRLFVKLLAQRQESISRTTQVLTEKFLADHKVYCDFVLSMEQLRMKCKVATEDVDRESDKMVVL